MVLTILALIIAIVALALALSILKSKRSVLGRIGDIEKSIAAKNADLAAFKDDLARIRVKTDRITSQPVQGLSYDPDSATVSVDGNLRVRGQITGVAIKMEE